MARGGGWPREAAGAALRLARTAADPGVQRDRSSSLCLGADRITVGPELRPIQGYGRPEAQPAPRITVGPGYSRFQGVAGNVSRLASRYSPGYD
ncbi:hypothetical protein FHS42_005327 [Streptomyces zagrosensis]|uniref:Uncharacterized protein n=1 Tax=Streptomyces zagrosensis TaxID=1042984 RepID=A0A7W9QDX3_9ACTN|nr:hypothetical protein [Streptomyces zagrosensis]